MKIWKKRIALVLSLVTIAALLSGCICQQLGVTVNKDGSGTIKATVGYSKTFVEMMQSDEDEGGTDLSEYKEKIIDGTTYYVMEEEIPFASVEEFNELMEGRSEDAAEADENTSALSVRLERASDTDFTLTVAVDRAEDGGEAELPEAAGEDYEGVDMALLDEMLIRYEFTFPTYMQVTAGKADEMLSVNGKTVTLDLMKDPAGSAKHVEYVVRSFVPVLKGFRDVPAGAWFAPYVTRSVELELFSGVKPLLILEGNVLDQYRYPREGSVARDEIVPLSRALYQRGDRTGDHQEERFLPYDG